LLDQQLAEEKSKNAQLQQRLDSCEASYRKQIFDIQKKYDTSAKKAKDLAIENQSEYSFFLLMYPL